MMKTIIFVYNANSGITNSVVGGFHKLIAPSTYSCKLCSITHGYLTEKKEWSKFIKSSEFDFQFLYKNEWVEQYGFENELPAIFTLKNNVPKVLISCDEIKSLNLETLIERLRNLSNQDS